MVSLWELNHYTIIHYFTLYVRLRPTLDLYVQKSGLDPHSFIHSFIHLFIHSFIHSFIHLSIIHSFIHLLSSPFVADCIIICFFKYNGTNSNVMYFFSGDVIECFLIEVKKSSQFDNSFLK